MNRKNLNLIQSNKTFSGKNNFLCNYKCVLMLCHQGSFFETQMENKKVKEKHLIIVLLNFYCA
jgi:hypothetical protein